MMEPVVYLFMSTGLCRGSISVDYCWSILRVSAGMRSEWHLNMAVNDYKSP